VDGEITDRKQQHTLDPAVDQAMLAADEPTARKQPDDL
jgi:hypothetical protein